jgi:hypothetical protein
MRARSVAWIAGLAVVVGGGLAWWLSRPPLPSAPPRVAVQPAPSSAGGTSPTPSTSPAWPLPAAPIFAVADPSGGAWAGTLGADGLTVWRITAGGPTAQGRFPWPAGQAVRASLATASGLWIASADTVYHLNPSGGWQSWSVATGKMEVTYLAPSDTGVWVTVTNPHPGGAMVPVSVLAIDPALPSVTPVLSAQSSNSAAFAPAPGGLAFGLLAGPGPNGEPLGYWGLFSPEQNRLLQQHALPGGALGQLVEPAGGSTEVVALAGTASTPPELWIVNVATAASRSVSLAVPNGSAVVGLRRAADGQSGWVLTSGPSLLPTVWHWKVGESPQAVARLTTGRQTAVVGNQHLYIISGQQVSTRRLQP